MQSCILLPQLYIVIFFLQRVKQAIYKYFGRSSKSMKEADEEEQRNINCMLKFDHYDLFC